MEPQSAVHATATLAFSSTWTDDAQETGSASLKRLWWYGILIISHFKNLDTEMDAAAKIMDATTEAVSPPEQMEQSADPCKLPSTTDFSC